MPRFIFPVLFLALAGFLALLYQLVWVDPLSAVGPPPLFAFLFSFWLFSSAFLALMTAFLAYRLERYTLTRSRFRTLLRYSLWLAFSLVGYLLILALRVGNWQNLLLYGAIVLLSLLVLARR